MKDSVNISKKSNKTVILFCLQFVSIQSTKDVFSELQHLVLQLMLKVKKHPKVWYIIGLKEIVMANVQNVERQ